MKFACPRCEHEIDTREGVCRNCEFALTVEEIVGFYWKKLTGRIKEQAAIQCPGCGQPVPLNVTQCPHPGCGAAITVGATVDAALEPSRRRWHGFLDGATPGTMRFIQWVYLLVSAAIVWWCLSYVEKHMAARWVWQAMLAAFFMVVIGILVYILVPSRVFWAVVESGSWRVKLALVCNYLTLLMVLHILIGVWWAKALTLAGLFVVTYVGLYVLKSMIDSAKRSENQRNHFDPSLQQGRRGRLD